MSPNESHITEKPETPEQGRKDLENELQSYSNKRGEQARNYEFWIAFLFWLQMAAAGAAFVLGLLPSESIRAWMVSLVAGVAAGCEFVVRGRKLRERANWFFACRDTADDLLSRLRHEMPHPITWENVAGISKEFRERRKALGEKTESIDADWPSGTPTTKGGAQEAPRRLRGQD
jgi:hypothetical protein